MAGVGRTRRAAVVAATVAVLAAGCSSGPARPVAPRASPSPSAQARSIAAALPAGAQRRALAARYLAIAKAGNRRLETEFGRLEGRDRGPPAPAHPGLLAVATTQRAVPARPPHIALPAAAPPRAPVPSPGDHAR